ncbi:hypothetical protein GF420_06365 [candidate division GN15 bacterium]|nr:hypothetical protein [candidate division GN15 bacterium]
MCETAGLTVMERQQTGMMYRTKRFATGLCVAVLLVGLAVPAVAQTTLDRNTVRDLALEFNREFLQAQQEVVIADADVRRARADAFPQINFAASYNRNFVVPSVFFVVNGETQELQTGFRNSYGAQVSLSQTLWQGGKVFTAIEIAKRYKRYSEAIANQVRAEVLYQAEQLYYDAILARSQLSVWEQALESNTANLEVVRQKYEQGIVPEYELLRARVERQNILPEIISAESRVRLTEKRLKSFLGIDLSEPVEIVESATDTSLAALPALPVLIDSAQAHRPEKTQAEELVDISREGVSVAKAEYWPSFEAVAAWDWQSASDDFTLSENNTSSWTAGLRVSLPIFDGFRRGSDVQMRKAQLSQARLSLKQTRDEVTLEVEDAYDRLLRAKKAVDIQDATIAAATEGLEIAKLRYESGVGTQLEVLSAQTALTEARRVKAEALFAFRVARAGLERATTLDIRTDMQ